MTDTLENAWEVVIGLEVHARLVTRTKLFCGCAVRVGCRANSQVCEVCLGLPGALPVLNRRALELAVRVGFALKAAVQPHSVFARKNYFYPDLAKGYQISQHTAPLVCGGVVQFFLGDEPLTVPLTRIHLEEDAAKNSHSAHSESTWVDFNRAGAPLVEIVSEPALRSAEEAEAYLRSLRDTLMWVGANDGNLEQGSFRCDANVSLRRRGALELGVRTELKNINSFRFVREAIDYEVSRQRAVLDAGRCVVQQTRAWDERSERTVVMRDKEDAHDYRYFPDPDLTPVVLDAQWLAQLQSELPELPAAARCRWVGQVGLTPYDAEVLSSHPEVARFFDRALGLASQSWVPDRAGQAAKQLANFIQGELLRTATIDGLKLDLPVAAQDVVELLALVDNQTINGKIAKQVFRLMCEGGGSARDVVEAHGLAQLTSEDELRAVVESVLAGSERQVEQYRAGKVAVRGYFVGRVMKATRGKANPEVVQRLLSQLLDMPPSEAEDT